MATSTPDIATNHVFIIAFALMAQQSGREVGIVKEEDAGNTTGLIVEAGNSAAIFDVPDDVIKKTGPWPDASDALRDAAAPAESVLYNYIISTLVDDSPTDLAATSTAPSWEDVCEALGEMAQAESEHAQYLLYLCTPDTDPEDMQVEDDGTARVGAEVRTSTNLPRKLLMQHLHNLFGLISAQDQEAEA